MWQYLISRVSQENTTRKWLTDAGREIPGTTYPNCSLFWADVPLQAIHFDSEMEADEFLENFPLNAVVYCQIERVYVKQPAHSVEQAMHQAAYLHQFLKYRNEHFE